MKMEESARGWPKLKNLLNPIAPQIASLNVRAAMYGQGAILRFTNNYGLEIFKHPDDDFFEMTVIRFHGLSYEFAYDTTLPDLNLSCSDEDVLRLCQEVSELK